jgi:hypothetical protein
VWIHGIRRFCVSWGDEMNNQELLAFAAKAAGISGRYVAQHVGNNTIEAIYDTATKTQWNPLVNDGDALGLVSILRISIRFIHTYRDGVEAYNNVVPSCYEWGNDASSLRRAIVRCAAKHYERTK